MINSKILKSLGKFKVQPIRIGKLQAEALQLIYHAAKVKDTSRTYQHAVSYAYLKFHLTAKGHSAPAISRAIKTLKQHGLIAATMVGTNLIFSLNGKKRKVQPRLVNQFDISQEILYLTDIGINLMAD